MHKFFVSLVIVVLFMPIASVVFAQADSIAQKGSEQKAIQAIVGEVKLKKIRAFPYCAVEMKGSYTQHEKAFQTLFAEANKQKVKMESSVFAVYYSDPKSTPEKDLLWEVGFAVSKGQEVAAPLKLKKWKFPSVASLTYEGEFEEETMTKAYDKLDKWIVKNGLKPVGPVMENYLSLPVKTASGSLMGKIEIMVPVEK